MTPAEKQAKHISEVREAIAGMATQLKRSDLTQGEFAELSKRAGAAQRRLRQLGGLGRGG